jgi:ribulose 1,5-bisphosphate synthetase/thiazole synthase
MAAFQWRLVALCSFVVGARALVQPSASILPDLVVIGGGSAGLTAAKFGARFGKVLCTIF